MHKAIVTSIKVDDNHYTCVYITITLFTTFISLCSFYGLVNDGRNIFIHPLNMAMLWRELDPDPEKWPQVLTFEVIDVESKSATDELRKRMKFVRHLPNNTPFDLVEVSMRQWGISPDIYADF